MASQNDYKVCETSVKHKGKNYPEGKVVPASEAKELLKEGFPASRLFPMSKADAKEAEAKAAPAPKPVEEPAMETEEETDEEAKAETTEEKPEGIVAKTRKILGGGKKKK